jgi:predicted nucleic acid-binding protein
MKVLLDTNVLGILCHKDRGQRARAESLLASIQQSASRPLELIVPELADFELRRKLLHIGSTWSLAQLDRLTTDLDYLPITTAIMRDAARLWADARRQGLPTAPPQGLDGDAILAAQALSVQGRVATTNRGHLAAFGVAVEDFRELTAKNT